MDAVEMCLSQQENAVLVAVDKSKLDSIDNSLMALNLEIEMIEFSVSHWFIQILIIFTSKELWLRLECVLHLKVRLRLWLRRYIVGNETA